MLGEWRGPSTSSVPILQNYEISDELNRRRVQVLERRYGGRLRAHTAATLIQRAFRQSRLLQQWRRLVLPFQSGTSNYYNRFIDYRQRGYSVPLTQTFSNGSQLYRFSPTAAPSKCLISPFHLNTNRFNGMNSSPSKVVTASTVPFHQATNNVTFSRNGVDYLSPRLTQRRIVPDIGHPVTNVWLPRSSLVIRRCGQSGSLPRLDKHTPPSPLRKVQSVHDTNNQKRRRQYRIALNFFNKKPARGIQLLIDWEFVEDNSLEIAKLLISRRGLSKQMVGEYISQLDNHFQSAVLNDFIDQIDLRGMEIDVALRRTLSFFRLPGEAQKIERIMQVFSSRYAVCNPDKVIRYHDADTIFILSFAIIMLNTDLHSPNIKLSRKMKLGDFINNLRGVDGGYDIDRSLLTGIYNRIHDNEFLAGTDHVNQVLKVYKSIIGKDKPKLAESHRRLVCYCRLNQVIDRVKRQNANAHQREVFLFNDLILITKAVSKKKDCANYTLRSWISLLGLRVRLYETSFYRYGISIISASGQELHLNSKSEEDRQRFVADVRESVTECTEMETIRINVELQKHSLLNRNEMQRDSGLSETSVNPLCSSVNAFSQNAQTLGLCSVRRLSYNSFDSGVVEENAEYYSHSSAFSPILPILTANHFEAAI